MSRAETIIAARIARLNATIAGMQASNLHDRALGRVMTYQDDDFALACNNAQIGETEVAALFAEERRFPVATLTCRECECVWIREADGTLSVEGGYETGECCAPIQAAIGGVR